MLRKQQKRAARGKQTAFRVGGQEVDPKRMARSLRRHNKSSEQEREKENHEEESPEPRMLLLKSLKSSSSHSRRLTPFQKPHLT